MPCLRFFSKIKFTASIKSIISAIISQGDVIEFYLGKIRKTEL